MQRAILYRSPNALQQTTPRPSPAHYFTLSLPYAVPYAVHFAFASHTCVFETNIRCATHGASLRAVAALLLLGATLHLAVLLLTSISPNKLCLCHGLSNPHMSVHAGRHRHLSRVPRQLSHTRHPRWSESAWESHNIEYNVGWLSRLNSVGIYE